MPLRVCVKTFPERTSWGEKAHPEHRWYHSNRLRAWTKCQRNVTFPLLSASCSTEMWRSSLMFLLPGRSWSLFVNNMPFHPSVASNPARNAPSCSDFPMEELPEAILLAPLCFPPLLLTIYVTHSAPTSCSLSFLFGACCLQSLQAAMWQREHKALLWKLQVLREIRSVPG